MSFKRFGDSWLLYYGPALIVLCVAVVSALCWLAASLDGGDTDRPASVRHYEFSQECGAVTVTYTAPLRRPAADVCKEEGL